MKRSSAISDESCNCGCSEVSLVDSNSLMSSQLGIMAPRTVNFHILGLALLRSLMPFVASVRVDIVHQQYDRNITGGMFLHNFSVIFQPPFQEVLSVGQKYSFSLGMLHM